MKTFKALAALLAYPESETVGAIAEIETVLEEEGIVGGERLPALRGLLARLRSVDLMDLQEEYVSLFDRVRSLSLHLFEHVHGESRDRGQAMVDLRALYERNGYALATEELPDYLPAFLEFLSYVDYEQARSLLGETVHLLESIAARLEKRGSAYGAVFQALLAIAGASGQEVTVTDADIRTEDDPAAMDAAWREEPAFAPAGGCGAPRPVQAAPVRFYKGAAA